MLDSLEREYKRDEDYCLVDGKTALLSNGGGGAANNASADRTTQLKLLINKHQEQKEAFMKACTHARGLARNFLKICQRASYTFHIEPGLMPEAKVKGKLLLHVYGSYMEKVGFLHVIIHVPENSKLIRMQIDCE